MRYVTPTGPAGEKVRFCHLRKDYFTPKAPRINPDRLPSRQSQIGRQHPTADFAVALLTVEFQLQAVTLLLVISHLAQLKALPNL